MTYQIILYVALFAFGYMTCFLFYFGKSVNFYSKIIKASSLFSLFIIARSLEHFEYSKTIKVKSMEENNDSEQNIQAAIQWHDIQVSIYKNKIIKELTVAHSSTPYHHNFEDWETAMDFLNKNKEFVIQFITKH
jgi:hypothetical protein